ncbi:MAG: BlaI/MecI/CopY family transcriptional regulator [Candidatus Micrarchaeota archaeon]|nr:BlaI/MecI/CopY family transcriptional regulator [Candidatus Micrarchaeota archaeon]
MKEGKFDKFLSPLEDVVVNVLFSKKELTSREIFRLLKKKGSRVALTSIAVTLDRLHSKGLVTRRMETCRGGFRYVYTVRGNKNDVYRLILGRTVDRLMKRFGPIAASYFNEKFGKGV